MLVAGVSFIDDIRSLPDSVRLAAQFVAMAMMFYQLDLLHWDMWWMVIVALVVCVGASNIINFMDGVVRMHWLRLCRIGAAFCGVCAARDEVLSFA